MWISRSLIQSGGFYLVEHPRKTRVGWVEEEEEEV